MLNHALMADIDAHLRSPAGNDNGLFTDIGAAATGGQTQMDVVFDDEAGCPPTFTVLKGVQIKPELAYRLAWFDGENAGGTWTLDLRDDVADANGGTLTSWSLGSASPPDPSCGAGTSQTTVYSSDFEANDGAFTHSGTGDQWARGLVNTVGTTTANPVAAFTTCNSGVNCWKTNLTGDLQCFHRPRPALSRHRPDQRDPPIQVTWHQRFQMESASFDHAYVDAQLVGGTSVKRLWEWQDATMTDAPGSPTVNVPASSGWSKMTADILQLCRPEPVPDEVPC